MGPTGTGEKANAAQPQTGSRGTGSGLNIR